jgi:PIN domain nuclease of toxin-antitoxin system
VAAPERLSTAAREAVERADRIGVSAIGCFEVATLVCRRRIVLNRPVGHPPPRRS